MVVSLLLSGFCARLLLLFVVWPRYRGGDAGIIDAGLEDSFSSL